jgi:general secretion pathway protein G
MLNRVASRHRSRATGFTLIELLLVLVILAVLAAIVVPKFTSRSEQARVTAAKTDIANLETSLEAFEVDNGRYPTSEEALDARINAPSGLTNWHGPYVKKVPNDPWSHPYVYKYPGTIHANSFDIVSLGPDGREGNDDLTN